MKRPLFLLLLCLLSAPALSGQESALPPLPGFAKAATAPAATPSPLTEEGPAPEVPDAPDAPAAEEAPPAPSATPPLPQAAPPQPDGAVPPGPGSPGNAAAPGDKQKVDFLQRSNLVLAKLLENERAVDPFGMVMDPANAKAAPVLADQYEEVEETPQLNNSSLKSALLTLPVTGVYPQKELLVLGARMFAVGDQFGMKLQDLTIRLRFEGIRGGEIFFKDMETRETTSIPFNPIPAEFEPMSKGSKRKPGEGIHAMSDLFIAN